MQQQELEQHQQQQQQQQQILDNIPVTMSMPSLPFPSLTISVCQILETPILLLDGRAVQRKVLVTVEGNHYEIGRLLKNSIFGSVYHAIGLSKGGIIASRERIPREYALKVYFKDKLDNCLPTCKENPFEEMAAMQFIRDRGGHDCLARQVECCVDQNNQNMYHIMEFINGVELFDYVGASGAVPEEQAKFIFQQIVGGVHTLRSMDIGHLDLSLENVMLVEKTLRCKIIDMGMCLRTDIIPGTQFTAPVPPRGAAGKRFYMAPEVVENVNPFLPQQADIWALGIMLFMLLTAKPPVELASPLDRRYRMIIEGRLNELLTRWNVQISASSCDLIQRMLQADPSLRLTPKEILEHPWLSKHQEMDYDI